jgi:hypothetical protein
LVPSLKPYLSSLKIKYTSICIGILSLYSSVSDWYKNYIYKILFNLSFDSKSVIENLLPVSDGQSTNWNRNSNFNQYLKDNDHNALLIFLEKHGKFILKQIPQNLKTFYENNKLSSNEDALKNAINKLAEIKKAKTT